MLTTVIIVLSAMLLKIKLQEKTEIGTITFIREQSTPHTVYYNGIYLFYDKSKGGICGEKNGQVEFLFHTKEPQAISANENYIYIVCDGGMQQYKRDGSMVAQNEGIVEGITYDDIYASEQYVYCLGDHCTVISKKTGNPLIRSERNPLNFKDSLVIEGDKTWEVLDRILKREENKMEVLVDLEEDVIALPTGNGTVYIDDSILCVAGSLFDTFPMPFSSHSVYANGPMNEQKREILRYVDLNHQENAKSYRFPKGNKVVYTDKEEFILYHKEALEFYNADDGSLKKRVKMKGVRRNEKYTVELCHDKLFFYQKGEIAETVNIK